MSGKASPPAKISPRGTPAQNSSSSYKTPTRTSVTPVDDLPIDSSEKNKSPHTSEINHDFDITMDQVKAYIKDFSLKVCHIYHIYIVSIPTFPWQSSFYENLKR